MARPRKPKYQGLPPNLTYDKTHHSYKYRRVDTRKFFAMGKNRLKAVAAAKQLNSLLMEGQDLVAQVMGTTPTLKQFIEERFIKHVLPERELADNTLRDYHNKFPHIIKALGDTPLDALTVKDIADFLSQYPPTQSNRYRSLLGLLLKYAVSEGLIDHNPATSTINRKLTKKRRRLKLDEYYAIYKLAEPWLKNAMEMALLTTQRREDILRMQFSDVKEGYLYVIQKKTEKHGSAAHLKIEIEPALKKVIQRCRDTIVSPYLIHRLPKKITKSPSRKHHTQILPDQLTKAFSIARDQTRLFNAIPTNERPTFHELRSLAIKLYEDTGVDAQALAGHANREMTDRYKAGHEVEWTTAKACLNLTPE